MSYEKAMKHTRNVRKCKKQANMYMGFDAGSDANRQNPRIRELVVARMDVARWFKERHDGNQQHHRECIREAITELRQMEMDLFPSANTAV